MTGYMLLSLCVICSCNILFKLGGTKLFIESVIHFIGLVFIVNMLLQLNF